MGALIAPADNLLSQDGTRLGIPEEFQVGDILHVKIDMLTTPFGDMQLSLGGKVSCALDNLAIEALT